MSIWVCALSFPPLLYYPPSLLHPALLPARDQALCGQTHRTQGADNIWKERVFGLCSGMCYVSPLTMEPPCCTVSGIQ